MNSLLGLCWTIKFLWLANAVDSSFKNGLWEVELMFSSGGKGEILCECQLPETPYSITVVRLEGQYAGAVFARCEHSSQQNGAQVAVSQCC